MRKALVSLVVLGLIVGIGADALAQAAKTKGRDPAVVFRPPSQKEMTAIDQRLQLTDEQRARMKKVNEQYRQQIDELVSRYKKAYQDLTAALQGSPDPARVKNEIQRVHKTHEAVVAKEAELWTALADSLSGEQAVEFWKMFGKDRLRTVKEKAPSVEAEPEAAEPEEEM
ncbi:MAG: periplasmic heavy metal sensor [Candidatus Abyssobacteria bacterium SURF_5]|uniref:Periplasmic heavy metal sensor n=1 Tax=Abyssobacteria bacterium (strain SURF_5) TaxID=2093360 RepID=A0A3A4PFB6_ABYX5|nr:MAG: periplasmic heavy metal sensor [Candidatus Abyssubacteria bacterium SURF_5]